MSATTSVSLIIWPLPIKNSLRIPRQPPHHPPRKQTDNGYGNEKDQNDDTSALHPGFPTLRIPTRPLILL